VDSRARRLSRNQHATRRADVRAEDIVCKMVFRLSARRGSGQIDLDQAGVEFVPIRGRKDLLADRTVQVIRTDAYTSRLDIGNQSQPTAAAKQAVGDEGSGRGFDPSDIVFTAA